MPHYTLYEHSTHTKPKASAQSQRGALVMRDANVNAGVSWVQVVLDRLQHTRRHDVSQVIAGCLHRSCVVSATAFSFVVLLI